MPYTTEATSFFDLIARGGVTMIPLLLCSLLAVAIVAERLVWGLRRSRVIPSALLEELHDLLARQRYEEIYGRCRADRSPLARLVIAAIAAYGRPKEEVREALALAARRESAHLQRYLGALGTIASVSPLLGLLGTVFGMITIFADAEVAGMGSGARLSGGISEALITTATGLTIAIPSLVFYRYFLGKVKMYMAEMEHVAVELLQRSSATDPAAPAASTPNLKSVP